MDLELGVDVKPKGAEKPASSFNSFDAMKCFALFTMMIDHFGLFGFSYAIEYRLIGRFSAPCFYFLTGFAQSYAIKPKLIFWAFVLASVNWLYNLFIPNNNSLNAIIACKLILLFVPFFKFSHFVLLVCLVSITLSCYIVQSFIEYGSLSLLHAISGHLVSRNNKFSYIWVPSVCLFHFIRSNVFYTYRHSTADLYFGMASFALLTFVFLKFSLFTFPPPRINAFAVVPQALKWVSCHSVEIYVLHLIAYKFHYMHVHPLTL